MLHNSPANRVDPLLLLLLRISDKVHGGVAGGEFERRGFVNNVFGALDGKAGADRDDATWYRSASDATRIFEPEELTLFEDEPAASPGFDVIALLGEPTGSFWVGPELDALEIFRAWVLTGRCTP